MPSQDHSCHDHGASLPAGPINPRALISARALCFARGGRSILQRVDLDLMPGEIVTLIGPNGAGKTTLVRMMLALERPDSGELHRPGDLVIGYAPQRFDVDAAIPLSVARFLTLGTKASSGARNADLSRIERALQEVGADGLAQRQLARLSGGELQRVVLARALLRNPQLLVLDEPVRGVDFAGEAELYNLIGRIRDERGVGVLLVSHDLHVVMARSDRVICLNGHVCCSGLPQSVAQHPAYARLFGPAAANVIGIYQHEHDHAHDLTGAPVPAPVPEEVQTSDKTKTLDETKNPSKQSYAGSAPTRQERS